MKKFRKIVLASALALSAVAVPLTTTQQASAASPNCNLPNDKLYTTYNKTLSIAQTYTFGTDNIEIISGFDVATLTPGNSLQPLKRGKVVVHEHFKNGIYISHEFSIF
ncbi:hypothetical protein ACIQ57_04735 [Lysinibacillus xylanilyticus]|uniref:hypothetical protein n=1 Tax=Lysinibacillus xylanilyticus TaxID=582475 RepID=UPI003819286B